MVLAGQVLARAVEWIEAGAARRVAAASGVYSATACGPSAAMARRRARPRAVAAR